MTACPRSSAGVPCGTSRAAPTARTWSPSTSVKRRLAAGLGDPAVPEGLENRLLALQGTALPPRRPWREVTRRGSRLAMVSASAAAVGAIAVAGLYTAGAPQARTPESMAQVRASGHEHLDWNAAIDNTSWPHATQVLDLDALDENLVRVDLTVDGYALTVWEGAGVLDIEGTEVTETVMVGEVPAYYVDDVWLMQSGRCVVAVSGPRRQALELLSSYDVPETTPVQRVIDGWNALLGGQA